MINDVFDTMLIKWYFKLALKVLSFYFLSSLFTGISQGSFSVPFTSTKPYKSSFLRL